MLTDLPMTDLKQTLLVVTLRPDAQRQPRQHSQRRTRSFPEKSDADTRITHADIIAYATGPP